ncbi:hypothetical protein [Myxococcus sp. CA039A]|uniref:hypothetical protein n=1 Tax=Myxococcus sp. CA039A TaxID=2741737 RepID=UPI00157B073B|nr:hypothetical protein [Myxococcus sp. CA039A]NTX55222.1 hypothetical protein [Myxococcus sp. CA039A]
MKWLVLPPHRDVTLVPEVPEGWHLLDLARDFVRRVFSAESVEAEALARESSPPSPQAMRELLLLRVAQGLRDRGPIPELRALGAVLTAISGPPHGVHLRLDDVELESGTTERSGDVQRVAGLPASYSDDVAGVLARFEEAECVRVWLERDLQLPAAVTLAQACPAHVALEVAGPFGWAHRKVLARMPAFRRAAFPEHVPPLRWRVVPLDGAPGADDVLWVPDGLGLEVIAPYPWGDEQDWAYLEAPPAGDAEPEARRSAGWLGACFLKDVRAFTGGARWAGHVSLGSLLAADVLVESGCQTVVVGFCLIENGRVMDIDRRFIPVEQLVQGYQALKAAGVRVVAEWWVGAPGVDEESLDVTLAALEGARFFDQLAGVRPFHASVERIARVRDLGRWWGHPGDPPADRDLSRSRPIEKPGTIPGARLPSVLASLASRLLSRAPLSPGRVAAAFMLAPAAPLLGDDTAHEAAAPLVLVRATNTAHGAATPAAPEPGKDTAHEVAATPAPVRATNTANGTATPAAQTSHEVAATPAPERATNTAHGAATPAAQTSHEVAAPVVPAPANEAAALIRLDADCAVVRLPASLDGAPKPTWYAANLRTGVVLAMDARLAPVLSRLTVPTTASVALGAVPEAQRAKLVETLVTKSILERTHG